MNKFDQGFYAGIFYALQHMVLNHDECSMAEELITEVGYGNLLFALDDSTGVDSKILKKVIGEWANEEQRPAMRRQLAARLNGLRLFERKADPKVYIDFTGTNK